MIHIFDINSHIARLYTGRFKPDRFTPTEKDYHNGEPVYMLKPLMNMVFAEMDAVAKLGYPNTHVVIVFDAPGKNFRHHIYPEYKANREPKPTEWVRQIALAAQMFRAMGFCVLEVDGVEADDVIGTLSSTLTDKRVGHVFFTGDKDLSSLVSDVGFQYAGKEGKLYDLEAVRKKFGLTGAQIIDFLAMKGDTVDGLPGIEGVGDKTAKAILQTCTLSEAIADPDSLTEVDVRGIKKVIAWLKEPENVEKAELMKSLTSLKTDISLGVNLKEMIRTPPRYDDFLSGYMRPSLDE